MVVADTMLSQETSCTLTVHFHCRERHDCRAIGVIKESTIVMIAASICILVCSWILISNDVIFGRNDSRNLGFVNCDGMTWSMFSY